MAGCAVQLDDEIVEMLGSMLIQEDGVQAVGRVCLGVTGADRRNAWPGGPVDRGYDDMPDAGLVGPREHRVAVGIETPVVDMSVAVSEFEHRLQGPVSGKWRISI